MSAPKHTPGPWEYMPAVDMADLDPGIRGADGFYVATVATDCGHVITKGNGLLLAAAPDLLAACKAVLAVSTATTHYDTWPDWLVQVHAAIAKAEGGTNA